PEATVLHLSAWSRAIHKTFGHKIYNLVARENGSIVGILPLIHVKTRLFGNQLISNAFAVYGGPVADSDAAHDALDQAAEDIGKKLNVGAIEYRNRSRLRPGWPAKTESYATFRRAMGDTSDAILKNIPRKQRAMVRKGIKAGLKAVVDQSRERHFAIYSESVRNLGTPVFPRSLFQNLLSCYGDRADILTIEHEGRAIASVLSFYFRNEVVPYYGGSIPAARAIAGNDYMYWALMEHAHARGFTHFDFGRSKFGTGPFSFKKNWGFEPSPLAYEFKLLRDQELPDVNPLNPKYQLMIKTWKKLPLPIANRVGPFVARGLG
ncbi:MAG: FemAB family XrtA/PEP-CTERM system-associated protein, partial [Pseudomonadota bacterium]